MICSNCGNDDVAEMEYLKTEEATTAHSLILLGATLFVCFNKSKLVDLKVIKERIYCLLCDEEIDQGNLKLTYTSTR